MASSPGTQGKLPASQFPSQLHSLENRLLQTAAFQSLFLFLPNPYQEWEVASEKVAPFRGDT